MHSSMAWRSAGGEFFALISARRSKASSMVAASVVRSVTCFLLQESSDALRGGDAFLDRRYQRDADALPAGIAGARIARPDITPKITAGQDSEILRGVQLAREGFVVALHIWPQVEGAVRLHHVEHRREDRQYARIFLAVQRAVG